MESRGMEDQEKEGKTKFKTEEVEVWRKIIWVK
jgi:hypothetical protein